MAVIKQGGYAENDSSQKLKEKRRQIIEEERIFQLKESLLAFYDKLMEKYELVHRTQIDDEESDAEEQVPDPPSRGDIEQFAQEYANTKPKGF